MQKKSTHSQSEVHAYRYIYDELSKKDWGKEQVFTQQECQKIKPIKDALGLQKPENVVEVRKDIYYIVESKNDRKKLNTALTEARDYAELINKAGKVEACFISGVAGDNDEGFICKSQFFKNGTWLDVKENGSEITSLLSKKQVETILKNKNQNIADVEIVDEEFIQAAEKINEILHENSINKDYRARFISTLLLALSDGQEIDLDEKNTSALIGVINIKAQTLLNKHKKGDFSRFIKIDEPSNTDNHVKVRAAIVQTVQELLSLNIRSAMRSGRDILGAFYEVFLKYGNGAKEIGIVLTPRHITAFAANVLDIQSNDLVFDPACGTGGFLVAAFDEVRKKAKNDLELDHFKENGIYGIEDQDPIIALAIVNMIFRGDGKSNMIEGNCFNKWLDLDRKSKDVTRAAFLSEDTQTRIPPITKVLMNPPFAQKGSKNKEYQFVNQALAQMQKGGTLFALLPSSVLFERATKQWRKDLLKENSLLAVITFPDDLFYPTATHTVGLFLQRGTPHESNRNVFWGRCLHDGFLKKKGKRLKNPKEEDELSDFSTSLKEFIKSDSKLKIKSISEKLVISQVDFNDDDFELVPEAYLEDREPSYLEITHEIENLVKETAGYLLGLGEKNIKISQKPEKTAIKNRMKYFPLSEQSGEGGVCKVERRYAPYLNEIKSDDGNVPYVTTTEFNNGVSIRCDTEPNLKKDTVTVSLDGKSGVTFYQFEDYIAGEKTAALSLSKEKNPFLLFYIAAIIRLKSWRYNYGRKLSMGRLMAMQIPLPINGKDESIDYEAITEVLRNSYGWEIIEAYL